MVGCSTSTLFKHCFIFPSPNEGRVGVGTSCLLLEGSLVYATTAATTEDGAYPKGSLGVLGVEEAVVLPVAVEGNNGADGVFGVDVEIPGFRQSQHQDALVPLHRRRSLDVQEGKHQGLVSGGGKN